MKKIRTIVIALCLVVLVALTAPAPYNVYQYKESGGSSGGAWFQYVATVQGTVGGNVAINSSGTGLMLDNRNYTNSTPTYITYNPPAGNCNSSWIPCKLEN